MKICFALYIMVKYAIREGWATLGPQDFQTILNERYDAFYCRFDVETCQFLKHYSIHAINADNVFFSELKKAVVMKMRPDSVLFCHLSQL